MQKNIENFGMKKAGRLGKIGAKMIALALAFAMLLSTTAFAATYSDVPANHWAFGAISNMADAGIIVGDSSGKYNPNLIVNKFYASKVIAKLAGYKSMGYTAAEKTYQDNAYEANKSTLAMFDKTFTKWDSTADKEIAYLLERQILTVEDVNKFISVQNGVEVFRGLTKEDASMFLVKLMDKDTEALSAASSTWSRFADDAKMTEMNKPYVYYMKKIGMVVGDKDNNFNPKNNVSKAVLAVMLNNVSQMLEPSQSDKQKTIESVSGTVLEVYASRGALQIENSYGQKSIHNIAAGTSITIDGFEKKFEDIHPTMRFSAVLVNDELTNFKVTMTESAGAYAPNTSTASVNLATVDGTVSSVGTEGATKTISIDVRLLNNIGQVYKETRVYRVSADCKVTRNNEVIPFADIKAGDLVSAQVSGTDAYSIDARLEEMSFTGTLIEKNENPLTGNIYYVVKDQNDKELELIVDSNTSIERAPNERGLNWNDIKLGDSVSGKTNYNVILNIKGDGLRSNVEGYVQEIHIYGNNEANIIFKDSSSNLVKEYALTSSLVDVYSMRVGDKLRLRLDSWEVDSYTKLENSATQSITGRVTELKSDYMIITPSGSTKETKIFFDGSAYIYDTIARKTVTPAALTGKMELFVTYTSGSGNHATSITILSK